MNNKNKIKNDHGFSLAELLIVIGIILALAGVAFIAVINYQRSLAQLERDSIAKEIYIAAQNHLTLAKSQGYLGVSSEKYGNSEKTLLDSGEDGVYFFMISAGKYETVSKTTAEGGSTESPAAVAPAGVSTLTAASPETITYSTTLINQMLPFGSIDETVRMGDNYIIRYNPASGTVLDVFYWTGESTRFGYKTVKDDIEYGDILSLKDSDTASSQKAARKNYKDVKAVIGWYGGGSDINKAYLKLPEIKVVNGDTLYVTVTGNNTPDDTVQLFIKGETSNALGYFMLKGDASAVDIVLDDIKNTGGHFCNINSKSGNYTGFVFEQSSNQFIPGENIIIYAKASSNSEFAVPVLRTVLLQAACSQIRTLMQMINMAMVLPTSAASGILKTLTAQYHILVIIQQVLNLA